MSLFVFEFIIFPFVFGWVGFLVIFRRRNWSHIVRHASGFLTGCLCIAAALYPFWLQDHKEKSEVVDAPVQVIEPGMLFSVLPHDSYVCESKKEMKEIAKALAEDDQRRLGWVLDSWSCATNFKSDAQYKVISVEPIRGQNEKLITFRRTEYIYDDERYTLSRYVGEPKEPPTVTTSNTIELRPGMLFDLNAQGTYMCETPEALAEHLAHVKVINGIEAKMLETEHFASGTCYLNDMSSVDGQRFEVIEKRRFTDIPGAVVKFRYDNETDSAKGLYVPISMVKPWLTTTPTVVKNSIAKLTPGMSFNVFRKDFVACQTKEQIRDFSQLGDNIDEADIKRLLYRNSATNYRPCYGNNYILPDMNLVVDKVEPISGASNADNGGNEIITFHYIEEPKKLLYTLRKLVIPSTDSTPSAAN